MPDSLAILFETGGGMRLLLEETVSGFPAVTQNALVNLLLDENEDLIFPGRGTSLGESAREGGIFSLRSAAHAANFAASDTLFFSRATELAEPEDKLDGVFLDARYFGAGRLEVTASFVSIDGRTLSKAIPNY